MKQASRSEAPRRRPPAGEIPDPPEARWGVVVVVASHLNVALLIGLVRCVGIFYQSWKQEFETSAKQTAAVQSVMTSFSAFGGIIGGILTKRQGCRRCGILGGLLATCGLLSSHWVSSIYQLYFTAVLTGTGIGLSYTAAIVIVALHFKRKYKTANAVAFSGSGTGLIAAPPLMQALLDNFGWRGAVLISAALMANAVAFSTLFRSPLRAERPNRASNATVEQVDSPECGDDPILDHARDTFEEVPRTEDERCCDATDELEILSEGNHVSEVTQGNRDGYAPLKDSKRSRHAVGVTLLKRFSETFGLNILIRSYRFALLCLLQFEFSLSYLGFLQFLIPRAESAGVASQDAAVLLSLFGVGILLGRLVNGVLISWRLAAEHVTTAGLALAGLTLLVANVDSYAALAVASSVQGFAVGFLVAVMVVLTRRFVGMANFAVGVALCSFSVGIGVLTGPVMAGWLLDATGNYETVFYVLAGWYFLCAVQMLFLPLLKRHEPGIDIQPSDR
ncbi:monocarboxylate transporter 12-like [Acanthaster planci]|uniref:Monocarboxylate transporter 12-like n=1 Tax=Acanthaster planci TaxID=133434 RepID=A0A8B7Y4I7_ACAPL|nr:monocarboxylate transporter 12-like [Acanthaster planci]